ncbi:lactate dehydrogenase [Brachyspira hyodysenteriae]|uniref:NAD(P)-dependent oxidoreductase n=1 Tax=Brachyspira hyodysenteriae TaxID=159 RepID=UPI00063DB8CB|nr:NAD(P)-dependent oxidoreductase [Brachyspira hyodysenteriae]KLI36722.1 lactate dehydrogenase [Brachyspira hyodysenteriae]
MSIVVYSFLDDESEFFKLMEKKYNTKFTLHKHHLNIDNVKDAEGFDSIVFNARDAITDKVLDKLKEYGVKYMSTRSVGYDNIDIDYANKIGIKIANVPSYSPNSVSEFTILSLLSLIKNYNNLIINGYNRNYTRTGLVAKEIRNLNIGVIGTGRIGSLTVKHLKGFSPKNIFVYSRTEKEEIKQYGKYVSLDELYKNSDAIIYHIPYNKETENMICKDSINKMKKGVYIINVSRGGIVNNKDLLDGLKSGHIGGAALDVYTNEIEYVNKNIKDIVLKDEIIEELFKMDNVIITPHFAFYTDEALLNMVSISIDNIFEFKNTGKCVNQIKNI